MIVIELNAFLIVDWVYSSRNGKAWPGRTVSKKPTFDIDTLMQLLLCKTEPKKTRIIETGFFYVDQ